MKKIKFLCGVLVAGLLLTGCGDEGPKLNDAVKGSFKITNGMTMDQVSKIMLIEPTGQEKIGDMVIWRYEGNTEVGEGDNAKMRFNNIIIKFNNGVVSNSGTFSCDLPKVTEE